ncbi:MAG: DKNYY domain-containing protein [Candidatus Moranbacteria bacterium]|nr:DKNYY domain-containing protein [Candidatus Moranbacteria bacterium]
MTKKILISISVFLVLFIAFFNFLDFSREIKSYGDFKITDKRVYSQKDFCEILEGFIACRNLDGDKQYKIVKGVNKDNFNFKFITGLKKTENSKEELVISDLDEEFNLPKYTCNRTTCVYNVSGRVDFYKKRNHGILVIKDDNVAIIRHAGGEYLLLTVDNVNFETFQYLGGKYSKDKNNIYYKNESIGADPETFIYEKGKGKAIGKGRDKNRTWIKGVLQEK